MTLLGDDAVVNDNELVVLPRPVGVTVGVGGGAMGGPSGVGNPHVLSVDALEVETVGLTEDLVLQLLHLSGGLGQLEQEDYVGLAGSVTADNSPRLRSSR